jgi:predicted enzyme related to lactoylglutathione lyase
MADMSGRVVHFELPADDMERAKAFYAEAFGWTLNTMPELNYTLVVTTPVDAVGAPTDPGAINGGMAARGTPVSSTVITIEVDDIDAALATVEKLGGKRLRDKTSVGGMGFTGYFTDPEGNVVGLWQNA